MTDAVARRMSDAALFVPAQADEVPEAARFLPFSHHGTQAMIQTPRQSRRPTPEERKFLDTLIFWRAIYAERGTQDSESGATVWSTIAAAELRMRQLRIQPLI